MTKLQQLLADARAAGYDVQPSSGGWIILKAVKVNQHKTKQVGLRIYADGTAFDVTVDLSIAAGVRSIDTMRRMLGI
jgi:hypothetical protein